MKSSPSTAGREFWRKRVPSSVVTPPLVAGERVFVMGVDRAVHAFDAIDGRRLWTSAAPR
jgi:outer membrane protein assembly factor BamB